MDSFLTACGATDSLTLDVEGPGSHGLERRRFSQPFVVIGRDNRAELLLDHDMVSRRHAYLQVIEGRVFFADLESRTGTIHGDVAVESGWLAPGEPLGIGPFRVHVVRPTPDEAEDAGGITAAVRAGSGGPSTRLNPLLARSQESGDLPRVILEFQRRSSGPTIWRMSQVLALVGSSPRCKVRLIDSNVSKVHCALLRTPAGLWIIDLLGRGGVTVNGASVRALRLGQSDLVELGQVALRPNFDALAGAAEPTEGWGGGFVAWGEPTRAGLPERQPRAWGQAGGLMPVQPAYLPPARPPAPTRFAPDQLPGGIEPAASDHALALLLNHFGQMQQQMLDQFQQSMIMLLQMFNGMHKEQMNLVREELDQLRALGNEIQLLKAEMGARAAPLVPPLPPYSPQPATGSGLWGTPVGKRSGTGTDDGAGTGEASRPGAAPDDTPYAQPPPAASWITPLVSPEGHGQGLRPANGSFTPSSMPPPRTTPFPAKPSPAPRQSGDSPVPAAGDAAFSPLEMPTGEVHDWLNQRLAAIEQEQQTRWQRIMNLLRGGAQ
jgi:pSer/pThr/pTyr-binding forkhead associated (FHA) protein